jgi:hypothetical protein
LLEPLAGCGIYIVMHQVPYQPLTYKAFADLGIGHLAYVRRVRADEAKRLFQVDVAAELELFSVHSADGKPIMLAATWDAAVSNAFVNNLQPVMIQ